jgi:CxxC motif-containing protein (DUF1111 family)
MIDSSPQRVLQTNAVERSTAKLVSRRRSSLSAQRFVRGHTLTTPATPATPANGVPGNFSFVPFSDFALHDMGSLGDRIGNDGDSLARTRMMRTAPLWGLRFRTKFLHDGRTSDLATAIRAHAGQASAAVSAFNALSSSDRSALLAALKAI